MQKSDSAGTARYSSGRSSLHSERGSVCLGRPAPPACPVDVTALSLSREDTVPSGLRAVLSLWGADKKH